MKLKLRIYGTVAALLVAAAFAYGTWGRGGKLDNSRDTLMILLVQWDPGHRNQFVNVRVLINKGEHTNKRTFDSPFREELWLRPGETVTIKGTQNDRGHITCTITYSKGFVMTNDAGPESGASCSALATAPA